MRAKLTEIRARARIAFLRARYPASPPAGSLQIKEGLVGLFAAIAVLNAPSALSLLEQMSRVNRAGEPRPEWMSSFYELTLSASPAFYILGGLALAKALVFFYRLNDSSARREGRERALALAEIEALSLVAHRAQIEGAAAPANPSARSRSTRL